MSGNESVVRHRQTEAGADCESHVSLDVPSADHDDTKQIDGNKASMASVASTKVTSWLSGATEKIYSAVSSASSQVHKLVSRRQRPYENVQEQMSSPDKHPGDPDRHPTSPSPSKHSNQSLLSNNRLLNKTNFSTNSKSNGGYGSM